MKICPLHCTVCTDPVCRAEGCTETGEAMFEICDWCGDFFIPAGSLTVCVACLSGDD